MEITTVTRGNGTVLSLAGRIDTFSPDELAEIAVRAGLQVKL